MHEIIHTSFLFYWFNGSQRHMVTGKSKQISTKLSLLYHASQRFLWSHCRQKSYKEKSDSANGTLLASENVSFSLIIKS